MLGIAASFKELFRLAKQFVRESHSQQPTSAPRDPATPAKPTPGQTPNDKPSTR